MGTESRNYDEELKALLKIYQKNNFLNPSICASYIDKEQSIDPVVYWVDNHTSNKEVPGANS